MYQIDKLLSRESGMCKTFVSRISGEITMETALRIQSEFKQYVEGGAESITLVLDSPGGNVAAGMLIYSIVKNSSVPVTGVALGDCGSIAFTILQACTSRGAQSETKFLVHFLLFTASAVIYYDAELAKKVRDGNMATQEDIIKIHLVRSNITRDALLELMKKGEIITSRYAMKLGMIDVIAIRGPEGWLTE